MKEVKFSPTIQLNDIKHKVKHIEGFLSEGEKVKITIKFVGREVNFPDTGIKVINNILSLLQNTIVDKSPVMEGKLMSCIISRSSKKNQANGNRQV